MPVLLWIIIISQLLHACSTPTAILHSQSELPLCLLIQDFCNTLQNKKRENLKEKTDIRKADIIDIQVMPAFCFKQILCDVL